MDFQPWSPPPQNSLLQTLSQILGFTQAQQNLQTGAINQETAQATADQAQQKNTELQAVGQLARQAYTNGRYKAPDGSFDNQKFADDVSRVAPVYGQQIASDATMRAGEIYKNQQTLFNLKNSQRQTIGNAFGAMAADPTMDHTKFIDGVEQLRDQFKDNPDVSRMLTSMSTAMPNTDGPQLKQALRNTAIIANSPTAAQTDPGAATYQGKNGIQAYQTNPQAIGGIRNIGAPLGPQGVAPAITPMPSGALGTTGAGFGYPGDGGAGGPGAGGAQAAVSKLQPLQRPAPNAPAADQQNYAARIKAAGDEQQAISQSANDPMNGVQATRYRNQQILDLIPHAGTGPYMRMLNVAASRLPGATGDAYQDLEHYTAQNSAALAKQMGVPGTNLGAETAAAAAGNVERNPGALAEITKTNDALNTAMDLYNRGLAKVTNNGSDLSRAPAYKQAFGQNLDINALRWADAHRRKDTQEIQQLSNKFGPQGIAQFTQKLNTIRSLAATGDLP